MAPYKNSIYEITHGLYPTPESHGWSPVIRNFFAYISLLSTHMTEIGIENKAGYHQQFKVNLKLFCFSHKSRA